MENAIAILIRTVLNLEITLNSMVILTILNILIHEYSVSFHLFVSSSIFKLMSCSFLSMGLLPPWLDLFQGILFNFFDAMVNEIVFLISLSDSLLSVIVQQIYLY